MSVLVPAVVRPPIGAARRTAAVPPLVTAAWAALFVNVLGWGSRITLIPVPHLIGQLIAQAALGLALVLALLANRRMLIRPQVLLVVLLVMAAITVVAVGNSEFLRSSMYRAFRFVGFVIVLWLLTPWFGRRDMALLRTHLRVIRGILATVLLGAVISPGLAFSFQGRLSGIVWPIPPTQVAHYSAVLLGITTLLWFCHVVRGRTLLVTIVIGVPLLLATHTRTALLACAVGLALAGASLLLTRARVRRALVLGVIGGIAGLTVFHNAVVSWLLRGQSTQDATQLTGRTKVWTQIEALHRDTIHTIFGNGISDMSFNGLPIDSSWFSTYVDEGWAGITLQVTALLIVLGTALARPRGHQRAVGLFVVGYCTMASITETGLGAPSPYLLDLAVAAAVLAAPLPAGLPHHVPTGSTMRTERRP